jgi:endonuclease/exonuclease/phosphatase family metal-dependent hydrolase
MNIPDLDAGEGALTAFQRSLALDRIYTTDALTGSGSAPGSTLRILSWNIGRGYEPARLAETLLALRPDVACLQEVDWTNERTGSRDVLRSLAERTGMLGLFGVEFLEVHSRLRPRRLAGGGATGNAILTRLAPAAAFRVELPFCVDWQRDADNPQLPWRVRRHVRRERRIGRRFGLGAEFAVGPHKLVVCSAHLEDKVGGVAGRWAQYAALEQAIETRRTTGDVGVIAGDFNTFDSRLARLFTPDTEAAALGKPAGVSEAQWWKSALLPPTGYADPFLPTDSTFAVPPLFRAKLDWITVRDAGVRDYGVGPYSSSDHRPIWIDLDLAR